MPTCRGEQAEAAEAARVEAEAEAAERLKGGEQEAFLLKKKLELAQGGREQVGLILSCLVLSCLVLYWWVCFAAAAAAVVYCAYRACLSPS